MSDEMTLHDPRDSYDAGLPSASAARGSGHGDAPDAWDYPTALIISGDPLVIPAAQFKANCLQLLDHVAKGEEILVTKRGKAVALLVPPPVEHPRRIDLRGSAIYEHDEDIIAPTNEPWPGESD